MIISIIVAVGQNNVIGKDHKLPWHLPADLKYFKNRTVGHHIIMGRTTYETLGRPLPGRTNIVVTRQEDYDAPGCVVAGNLELAFEYAKSKGQEECFVIGGGEIFRQSLNRADKIYFTRVMHEFDGDTFFPEIDLLKWKLTSEDYHQADEKNKYDYNFQVYSRINGHERG